MQAGMIDLGLVLTCTLQLAQESTPFIGEKSIFKVIFTEKLTASSFQDLTALSYSGSE